MDVIFEPQRRERFSIEVGFFDSVLEIKEKIQKYHNIPISNQTLIFNTQVLQDDHDVAYYEILQNSIVHLIIASDHDNNIPTNSNTIQDSSSSINKIQLALKIPTSKIHVLVEMDANDTIGTLKEKIQETEGVPVSRLALHSGGTELHDHRCLRDCELSDNAEIEVSIRHSQTTVSAQAGTAVGPKKLRVMVLPKCGTKKIPVEVNANDSVGELRKELQRLHQKLHFHLPQEGYFFIYKQNVMDDDKSFRWHHVAQGDTIEIFNGSITGGS
ncbi:ubiquitin domain-containing protein 7SL RNA2 [Ziziphus jujuba]|uniref:Ubiquitin domain-containing protein 7SL RNA2 n=2 Tax=Ziziphus jujuba TaxID=326968 RepID=A0A6P4AFU0_ZIZJJ|nr:ubiquitin domain-containing protein 7SL RNA2 [Ziziphus jujuba]KAH7545798.1 hypothetical protein FEM48_Zijuj01G0132000 [Ziziphus jujuba var. spinosa]